MMKKTVLAIALAAAGSMAYAADYQFDWQELPQIPAAKGEWKQLGLAGAVAGVDNDVLLVGGGANFPEIAQTATRGNVKGKVYWDNLYVLEKKGDDYQWLDKQFELPDAVAYAVTLQTPKGLMVIGGEGFKNGTNGTALKKRQTFSSTYFINWNDKSDKPEYTAGPELPVAMSYHTGALIGDTIYVASKDRFLSLDLNKLKAGWKEMPKWPGGNRQAAESAVVDGEFFLFSGRTKEDGKWIIYKDSFKFNPKTNKWSELKGLSEPMMAGAAYTTPGDDSILLLGGADGVRFLEQQKYESLRNSFKKGTDQWEKNNDIITWLFDHHNGFESRIMAYSPSKDSWTQAGWYPGEPVATFPPVVWGENIFVVSGEIRPGVRTPRVWRASVTTK